MHNASVQAASAHLFSSRPAAHDAASLRPVAPRDSDPSPFERIACVRRTIAARSARKQVFPASFFNDPAWDMLLELYVASLAQRHIKVSKVIERTGVPASTVKRWVDVFHKEGLVRRDGTHLDARLVLLSLTDAGRKAMDDYFDRLPSDAVAL